MERGSSDPVTEQPGVLAAWLRNDGGRQPWGGEGGQRGIFQGLSDMLGADKEQKVIQSWASSLQKAQTAGYE